MTPEPGTPMVTLAKAHEVVEYIGGPDFALNRLTDAAVPWPAPPAAQPADETLREAWRELYRIARAGHIYGCTCSTCEALSTYARATLAAPPATRDDHHPAEPHSEAALDRAADALKDACYANGVGFGKGRPAYRAAVLDVLRAAATPTTPAGHVLVRTSDLALIVRTDGPVSERLLWTDELEALARLRAALTAAQQDANNE